MRLRLHCGRIGQGAGKDMALVWKRLVLVGERRAALAADAAPHAARRGVVLRQRGGEAQRRARNRQPCCHRRRDRAPAALAVAVERPIRLTVVGEPDRFAKSVSGRHVDSFTASLSSGRASRTWRLRVVIMASTINQSVNTITVGTAPARSIRKPDSAAPIGIMPKASRRKLPFTRP